MCEVAAGYEISRYLPTEMTASKKATEVRVPFMSRKCSAPLVSFSESNAWLCLIATASILPLVERTGDRACTRSGRLWQVDTETDDVEAYCVGIPCDHPPSEADNYKQCVGSVSV